MVHRIEPVHPGDAEHHRGHGCHAHVNEKQDIDDFPCLKTIIVLGQCGQLHAVKRHLRLAERRQDGECEHDDADTAYPMRRRTPEEQSVRQRFHIGEYRGTGRGESRYALEPGIDEVELPAIEQVGESAHEAGEQPCTGHDAVPLLGIYLFSAADEKGGEHTEYGCQQKREEQRRETAVHAVYPRNARRKEHKGRIEQQYGTDVFQYQSGPHFGSVFFRSTNSSIISLSPSISSSLPLEFRGERYSVRQVVMQ